MTPRKHTYTLMVMTLSLAHTILMQELYERQRPLSQSYVRQYALLMQLGEFREGTVISFAVWQGRRYLINGQHTLHAIILAGIPLELCIEEIEVESYDEIAHWYAKYDRLHLRTLEHTYYAHNLAEAVQLNKSQTVQLGGCLPLMASGFDLVPRSQGSMRMYVANPEIRMAFIRQWADEAEHYFQDIKGAPGTMNQNLRRAPVLAVALITYRYTGTDASEFWHSMAMDDRLAQNDPKKRLHLHIRTTKLSEYLPHVYSRIVARAWNAAWDGRTPVNLVPESVSAPIRIAGTPHDGTQILRYITPRGEVLPDAQPYKSDDWQRGLFAA